MHQIKIVIIHINKIVYKIKNCRPMHKVCVGVKCIVKNDCLFIFQKKKEKNQRISQQQRKIKKKKMKKNIEHFIGGRLSLRDPKVFAFHFGVFVMHLGT